MSLELTTKRSDFKTAMRKNKILGAAISNSPANSKLKQRKGADVSTEQEYHSLK